MEGEVFIKAAATQSDLKVFNGAVCADNNGTAKCQAALTAGTVYGDASDFQASDVAENYPSIDDAIEAGDIVAVVKDVTGGEASERLRDKEKIKMQYQNEEEVASIGGNLAASVEKATNENSARVLGVISTKPGVLLGGMTGLDLESDFRPVALAGRIPVKVNGEGGAIQTSDKITVSSVPGVGKKASGGDRYVGIALEPFNGTSGQILMFVNLGWAPLDGKASDLAKSSGGGNSSPTYGEPWGISIETGKVYTGYTADLQNNDLINVRNILSASGAWSVDETGKLIAKEIETEKLKVGTSAKRTGITLYDTATGEPYCLTITNGVPNSNPGECFVSETSSPEPVSETPTASPNVASSEPTQEAIISEPITNPEVQQADYGAGDQETITNNDTTTSDSTTTSEPATETTAVDSASSETTSTEAPAETTASIDTSSAETPALTPAS